MSDCECIPGCPFFNDKMENRPATANLYKLQYCKGEFVDCARYKVFKALGKSAVPMNLFPNQSERALEIIKAEKASV